MKLKTGLLCYVFAKWCGLSKKDLDLLTIAGFAFDVVCNLTERQRAILLAGGLLNYTKEGGQ